MSLQISEDLGRNYDSMLRFMHEAQSLASSYASSIKIEGIAELNEAYVHSGEKGEKRERPGRRASRRRGTWDQDKPPVLTVLKGGGKDRFLVMRDLKKSS